MDTYCSPTYKNTYFDSPEFFVEALHAVGFFSIPVNVLGGYCILLKTPKEMSSVKWSLFNLQFTSFVLDLTLSFLCTAYIFVPVMAGYGVGIVDIDTAKYAYIIVTVVFITGCAIVVVVENRLFILLINPQIWKYARYPFLGFFYFTAVATFVPVYIGMAPGIEYKKEFVIESLPCLPDAVRALPLYLAVENKWQFLIWTVGESTLFCVTCLALFLQIYRALRKYGEVRSKQTLELQKRLFKAIFLQLAIPFSIISMPMIYYTYTPFFNAILNSIMFITVSSHGFISTIVMLIVQKPYREFILGGFEKFLRRKMPRDLDLARASNLVNSRVMTNQMF